MSDATSINAILSQRVSVNKSAPNSKLVEIPKALEHVENPQILRGEVLRKSNNGTITIKTDKGEIKAKIEQNIVLQKGDIVEIRINKGNPPQNANVKLISKIIPQKIQPQNIMPKINLVQNLSAKELMALETVKVELLTPQIAQKLTNSYIGKIDTILNLGVTLSILPKSMISENSLILTQNLNDIIARPVSELFPLKSNIVEMLPTSQKYENIAAYFKMDIPKTEIPLRHIITQIMGGSSFFEKLIGVNPLSPIIYAPDMFEEISIMDIKPPLAQISYSAHQDLATERVGDIRAILAGFTMDKNLPVIKIITPKHQAEQHYILQTRIEDIPLGSQIELKITKSTSIAPSLTQNIPIAVNHNILISPDIWPVMQEITQVLVQANPAVAQGFSNIVPNAANPAQLGSAAMFFLAAMRSGDVQSWLGERAIDVLKRAGKSDLISRLGMEFSTLSRMSSDGIQEWRSLSLPLAWQNEIHKIAVHYRREEKKDSYDNSDNCGAKVRFVMDLNLSNMGKIQLDGLFIADRADKKETARLELILRSEQPFSKAMKTEMRQKYKAALDETGLAGDLSFQDKPDQWVNIMPNTASEFSRNI